LAFAKAQPEQGNTREVNSDDREIEMVKTHAAMPGVARLLIQSNWTALPDVKSLCTGT
jgi:hypothetical protein